MIQIVTSISRIIPDPDHIWHEAGWQVKHFEGLQETPAAMGFTPCLYNTVPHLVTQGSRGISSFYLFHQSGPAIVALLHCSEQEKGSWISPSKAPFGGVESSPDCPKEALTFLISCTEALIISRGGYRFTIKAPPLFYLAANQTSAGLYSSCGYFMHQQHVNHCIPVTTADFESGILPQEKRRIKKCRKAGFRSALCNDLPPQDIYNFLKAFRLQRGYTLSLSDSELTHLMKTFPERFLIFGVMDQNKIIALTIVVTANRQVVYNFLAADLPEYRSFSPVVMLTECLYRYCQKENFKYLDLGISLDHNGHFKPSLARFKKNIGGQEGEKVSYVKFLS
ncbi:GNAT family N-acetyltransferase [Dyadobacter helix]|nr:GNAT family N-acetyltransferase [Dyadobacter sp. CECT 9275]